MFKLGYYAGNELVVVLARGVHFPHTSANITRIDSRRLKLEPGGPFKLSDYQSAHYPRRASCVLPGLGQPWRMMEVEHEPSDSGFLLYLPPEDQRLPPVLKVYKRTPKQTDPTPLREHVSPTLPPPAKTVPSNVVLDIMGTTMEFHVPVPELIDVIARWRSAGYNR